MVSWNPGDFVSSKAGHDKGQTYIIIRETEEYIYLSDGKIRSLDKLKKRIRSTCSQSAMRMRESVGN